MSENIVSIADYQQKPYVKRVEPPTSGGTGGDGMDTRLRAVEVSLAEVRVDTATLKGDAGALKSDMATVKSDLSYLKGKVDALPTIATFQGLVALMIAIGGILVTIVTFAPKIQLWLGLIK